MAATPNPDDVLRSTTGKSNFQRAARLLISGGTTLLREIFDLICPPSNLSTTLKNPTTEKQLKAARLTKPQWDCLYPSPGLYGKSTDFDVTLLFKLLRTICSLSPPLTGWDVLPASTDHSLAADLARIKYYRNSVYGHVNQKMEITDDEFPLLWQEISESLVRVAGQISHTNKTEWQGAIGNFLNDPLTAEDERNVQELLRWYENDIEVKKSMDELKSTTQERIERLETSLEEKRQNLEMAVRGEAQKMKADLGKQLHTTTEVVQEGIERLETRFNVVQGGLEGTTRGIETAVREESQDIKVQLGKELKASTVEVQKSLETSLKGVHGGLEGTTREIETVVREESQDVKEQLEKELKASTLEVQKSLETSLKGVHGGLEGTTREIETAVREEAQDIKEQLGEELKTTTLEVQKSLETSLKGINEVKEGLEGTTHVLEATVREEAQDIKDKLEEVHQSIDKLNSQAEGSGSSGGNLVQSLNSLFHAPFYRG